MTLFHQVCQRRPTVRIEHETEVNDALQNCLTDVIALFAAVAAQITVWAYAPQLMELIK